MVRNCIAFFTVYVAFQIAFSPCAKAQNTVGTTFYSEDVAPGYVLFAPSGSTRTFLIDRCGQLINEWISEERPGLSCYLLDNGDLLRTRKVLSGAFVGGGVGGMIERYDWDGNLIWSDTLASAELHQHHDLAYLPNGNILTILWEKHTAEEAIERGRRPELTPEEVWVTRIVELAPLPTNGSEIVWSWSPWEHLIQDTDSLLENFGNPADHPTRFDVNFEAVAEIFGPGIGQSEAFDWLHVNSIDYDEERDEIVLSSRNWSEIWVIDHSTTMEEAHSNVGGQHGIGGDILWRWGNPAAYGVGDEADKQLFGQHDAQFIDLESGKGISVFNNGLQRPDGEYSTIHQIELPLDEDGHYIDVEDGQFLPPFPIWTFPEEPDLDFYSAKISGYDWIDGSHHLVCEGMQGHFFEVDQYGNELWEYFNPMTSTGPLNQGDNPIQNSVFRAKYVAPGHPGLAGRDLTPSAPLELFPDLSFCPEDLDITEESGTPLSIKTWPNPAKDLVHIEIPAIHPDASELIVYNAQGQEQARAAVSQLITLKVQNWPSGIYLGIINDSRTSSQTSPLPPIKIIIK
ncbi:MAG: aryl-sulfate sulfotransferase [Flavobacteriales bacterium]